jgi:SpoVK/Ycf46/Vps4 family AAA+-type ATPase
VEHYLLGLGSDNFLERYAKILPREALALERFSYTQDVSAMRNLLVAHDYASPLHVLLYGVEGTGKTEMAYSLAAAAGYQIYEIGRDLRSNLPARYREDSEAVVNFRLRALHIAELSLRRQSHSKVALLLDEADSVLNHTEKGTLNQFLEETHLPVIWVANSVDWMATSTQRRFLYSLEFRMDSPEARTRLWESVVEKHHAHALFPKERQEKLAASFEVSAGGIELAVHSDLSLAKVGLPLAAESVLKRHARLLGLSELEYTVKSRAPKYSVEALNVKGLAEVNHAVKCYSEKLKAGEAKSGLSVLLYGPPGTGKTEFARHIARECGLQFMERSYAELSSKYVGESEKLIQATFEAATEDHALLFIDEADSLVGDRRLSSHSWEISQVNQFLTSLESARTLVVCSTNFQGHLDAASRRRFPFSLEFDYLLPKAIPTMVEIFFPQLAGEDWSSLERVEALSPGDFYAAYRRLEWLPGSEVSAERVVRELKHSVAEKEAFGARKIGF